MELIKKLGLTVIIILFLMSIFKDLTVGTIVQDTLKQKTTEEEIEEPVNEKSKEPVKTEEPSHPLETDRYSVVSKTTQQGDTVLSIIESVNQGPTIQIDLIIEDFKKLNPNVDPHKIQPNEDYLFPKYKN